MASTSESVHRMSDGQRARSGSEQARLWATLRLLLRRTYRAVPRLTVLGLVIAPLGMGVQALNGLALKFLADALVVGNLGQVGWSAAGLFGLTGLSWVVGWGGARVRLSLQERAGAALSAHLAEVVVGIRGIAPFEHPETADKLQQLESSHGYLGGTFNVFARFLSSLVQVGVSIVLLASVHPLLMTLPAMAALPILSARSDERAKRRLEDRTAAQTRLARSLFNLSVEAPSAKELRTFEVRDELARREDVAREEVHRQSAVVTAQQYVRYFAAYATVYLALGAGLALVAHETIAGRATVGDVLMVASLITGLFGQVQGVVGGTSGTLQALRYADRYRWVVDYAQEHNAAFAGDPTVLLPERLAEGIRLENVGFVYPGTDDEVLRDVTVDLPAGSVVALVGDNGAGKTTLIKLLARLHDATTGTIHLDDVDLVDLDAAAWRTTLSAGFQDFVKWQLLMREAVGISDVSSLTDDDKLHHALSMANAAELPADMPDGLDTQLGRDWEGGVELSEGQWQKLALARAANRSQPLLLILDEPTASLDADTEHELFEVFAQATRTRRPDGAITLLVSHRFSTVRMADLIVVLDDGVVRESGTHEELMASGDLYAELYTTQADAYR